MQRRGENTNIWKNKGYNFLSLKPSELLKLKILSISHKNVEFKLFTVFLIKTFNVVELLLNVCTKIISAI